MFIKVENNIVDVILQSSRSKERERAIDVMVQLMTSSRMNYHKVYMKCILGYEDAEKLKSAIDENSWREFQKLQRERFDVEGLISVLEVYVVITNSKHSSRVGKELLINPFETSGFLLGIQSYLATENQRDSVLYQYIAEAFKRRNRLLNMNSSFKRWKGGGSDFGNALRSDEILKSNFVIAIADSDKHCPMDNVGQTAKGIKYIGHYRYNADYYILNDVMEAENLIPYRIIIDKNQDFTKLTSYDLSYFDFKEGLKYTILYDKNTRNYWKSNFTGLQIDWNNIECLIKGKTFSDYCKAVHDMPFLISGLGPRLLESLLDDKKWKTISERELTDSQQKEWTALGKKIFSWTCCSQKKV